MLWRGLMLLLIHQGWCRHNTRIRHPEVFIQFAVSGHGRHFQRKEYRASPFGKLVTVRLLDAG